MMEESYASKCHGNAVLVASVDNMVITDRTACLCDILHSALVGALDVIAKWEESV